MRIRHVVSRRCSQVISRIFLNLTATYHGTQSRHSGLLSSWWPSQTRSLQRKGRTPWLPVRAPPLPAGSRLEGSLSRRPHGPASRSGAVSLLLPDASAAGWITSRHDIIHLDISSTQSRGRWERNWLLRTHARRAHREPTAAHQGRPGGIRRAHGPHATLWASVSPSVN